jgi:cytochrome P450
MMTDAVVWPEYVEPDRSKPESLELEHEWFRLARRANWHGLSDLVPGVDVVVRHTDARSILMDGRFEQYFSQGFRDMLALNPAAAAILDPWFEESKRLGIINQDGPRHREIRALFSRTFTPRSVSTLRPFVEDLGRGLVDALVPGADFVAGFAAEVPALTLCELIGIPTADRSEYLGWVAAQSRMMSPTALMTMTPEDAERYAGVNKDLDDYTVALIEARRQDPCDDLVSRLVTDPECPLDDRALAVNLGAFLFAGNDTTQRMLGLMVMVLQDRPDVWEAVAADPDFAPAVVEECLRVRPPAGGGLRRTTCPVEYRDTVWPPDQVVFCSGISASQDEEVFGADAMTFDPYRPNAKDHLAFGHGPHYCIGANLARMELQESLKVLTSRITCPKVLDGVEMAVALISGPTRLPITFTRRN